MNPNKKETIYMPQIELSLDGLEILQFFISYVHKIEDENSFYFNGKVVRGREKDISIELDLEQAQDENLFEFIGFGGWNDCPSDKKLYSTICEWNKQYGVKLEGISSHAIALNCSRELTEQQIEELVSAIISFCPSCIEAYKPETRKSVEKKLKEEGKFFLWWD